MSEPVIRPYHSSDREQVRRICYLTGYLGDPADWFWRDQESFADMFSGYYTDLEPESALVVEVGGEVSGYLLGCVDSRRAWNPGVVAARHALRRGLAFRPSTARIYWRSITDLVHDLLSGQGTLAPFEDERYPAHLHIDLLPVARGMGVGARLVRRWLEELTAKGVPGCHLETILENTAAVAFFEAVGFRPAGRNLPIPGWRTPDGRRHHSQVMVQDLGRDRGEH